jgi:hypothetical protein
MCKICIRYEPKVYNIMGRPINPLTRIKKTCPTCSKEFETKRYKSKTYCCKSCACNSPAVKEKNRNGVNKTFNKKYGGHAMTNDQVKKNFKSSMKEKYGVEYYSQRTDEWKSKVKSTLKERYGDESYNNSEQAKKTMIEKYGVDNALKSEDIKNRVMETKSRNHLEYLKTTCKDINVEMLTNQEEYKGNDYENKYKFKCLKCDTIFESDVYLLKNIICEKCNPLCKYDGENSLYEFLKSIFPNEEVRRRDRTILNGMELDFVIESQKIAIEYNGLYWHSEFKGKHNKVYHLNKTNQCLYKGYRLIHIYENEWTQKTDIIKSILNNVLTKATNKIIYARECEVKRLIDSDKNKFLNENHIQGSDKSAIKYGLYYNNELVSLMTFCKSRFDKKIEWELSRYSVKLNHAVVGGASRLFTAFKREFNPRSVITYSDRRYFQGDVYSKMGFVFIHNTPPNYFYISKDYKVLYNRMHYQKKKLPKILEIYNEKLTEWENMKINGYDRIWDCGVSKWVWHP